MRGYFRDDSVIRRVGNESVLMLGGGRALLMQAAHPLVAAGIVDHSDHASDPLRRLVRTMGALYTVVFGTRAEADAVAARVRAVHAHVRGERDGVPYAATDPELALWVHATLVDTGIVMHDRFVRPLDRRERGEFYRQMKTVARVFGVPPAVLPPRYDDYEDYLLHQVTTLRVGDDALAVARTVLDPAVPLAMRPAARAVVGLSMGLLPAPLREQYRLRWTPAHRAVLALSSESARRLVVPKRVRSVWSEAGRYGLPLRLLDALASL
ncbi:MAG TPA: oxygenase MpaB family protein [Solirubrobacteraceae bacterium]|jgi:uncharacterized protein (DUF2236 family)